MGALCVFHYALPCFHGHIHMCTKKRFASTEGSSCLYLPNGFSSVCQLISFSLFFQFPFYCMTLPLHNGHVGSNFRLAASAAAVAAELLLLSDGGANV